MCWVNVLWEDHIFVVSFLLRCSAIFIERLRILLSSSGYPPFGLIADTSSVEEDT